MRIRDGVILLIAALAADWSAMRSAAQEVVGSRVDVDQRIGEAIPLEARLRNEAGERVELSQFFGTTPVILVPVYYRCPMLCTQVLNSLVRTLIRVPLDARREFQVIVLSIDPSEQAALAAQKKLHYLEQYNRPGASAGWHFLTGDEVQIRTLTEAVGFHYTYDSARDEYAHPAAVILLTRDGRIGRYLLGLNFSPMDLRLALLETGDGRLGTFVDAILLRCYRYDPATGRYGFAIMTSVRAGGVLTVLALVGAIVHLQRKSRKAERGGR